MSVLPKFEVLVVHVVPALSSVEEVRYLRNSPLVGDNTLTSLKLSSVAFSETEADEPSPAVCETVSPVPAVMPDM